MLKVYIADLAGFSPSFYEKNINRLDEHRKNHIVQYKFKEDRLRGLAAGLLLKKAAGDAGLTGKRAAVIGKPGEKPHFADSRYFFNISHAGNFAVCAFADCEIGVDIETYDRFERCMEKNERLAKRILTAEEAALWEKDKSDWTLLVLWTKKESFAKLTGRGIGCAFDEIDTLHKECFLEKNVHNTAYLTVCTRENQQSAELLWMDENMSLQFSEKMI